jgi:hypothetical protein
MAVKFVIEGRQQPVDYFIPVVYKASLLIDIECVIKEGTYNRNGIISNNKRGSFLN